MSHANNRSDLVTYVESLMPSIQNRLLGFGYSDTRAFTDTESLTGSVILVDQAAMESTK